MGKLLELNQYLIREKFLKIFGNKFRIMDAKGELYGFCEQKRFKIKDELNVYDDEFKTHEWLRIKQKNYVDMWGGFEITDPTTGEVLGSVRRKFWKSVFRTKWELLDADGNNVGVMQEDSLRYALLRRLFLGIIFPKRFTIKTIGNDAHITMRNKFNPILLFFSAEKKFLI